MSEVLSGCVVRAEIQRERADVKWLSPVLVRHFKGKKLCLLHAKIAALQELAGPEPSIVLTTRSGVSE